MTAVDEQLSGILDLLNGASARVDQMAERVAEEGWHARPGPGAWSAAQCVAHLNITSEAYREPLMRGLEEARTLGGGVRFQGRHRPGVLGWMAGRMVGPAPRIGGKRRGRVKAPAPFVPTTDPSRDEVAAEFRRHQAWLVELVRACDGLPIHRVKVASVFVPAVRFNLYATLIIVARHQHRHLQQAEEATGARQAGHRPSPGAPAPP